MSTECKLAAGLVAFLAVIARCGPATQPAFRVEDLDLSTPKAAAVTHWKTRMVTDPAVFRAQWSARSPAEKAALDVWIGQVSASVEFDRAVIERFGEAARGPGGVLGPDTQRATLEPVRWQEDGSVAVPVNPPPEAGERKLVLENGKWLQPVSVWICTDEQRLAEVAGWTGGLRQLTSDLVAGKYKDMPALYTAWQAMWQKAGENQERMQLLLPARLPDTNPTTPAGSLASFAMAVVNRDRKAMAGCLVSTGEAEKAFTQATADWLNADLDLNDAMDQKFGPAMVKRFWQTSELNTPTLFAYALLYKIDRAECQVEANGRHATVGVPGALAWDMRKTGDRWQISPRDTIAAWGKIDGGAGGPPDDDAPTFSEAAKVERNVARDVASGKIATVEDVKAAIERGMDAAKAQPTTHGS